MMGSGGFIGSSSGGDAKLFGDSPYTTGIPSVAVAQHQKFTTHSDESLFNSQALPIVRVCLPILSV